MTLYYQSTRNPENRVTASQAILKGIAEDGASMCLWPILSCQSLWLT